MLTAHLRTLKWITLVSLLALWAVVFVCLVLSAVATASGYSAYFDAAATLLGACAFASSLVWLGDRPR